MSIALAQLIDKELNQVEIDEVIVDDDSLTIELLDGCTIAASVYRYGCCSKIWLARSATAA